MELDLTKRTLKYFKNGTETSARFDDIEFDDRIYHLAVSMDQNEYGESRTSVQLIDFEIV